VITVKVLVFPIDINTHNPPTIVKIISNGTSNPETFFLSRLIGQCCPITCHEEDGIAANTGIGTLAEELKEGFAG
jgi:hypothetical protein